MKRLAITTALCVAVLAGLYLLWEFRIALVLFILSLMLAAILRPMVDRLMRLRLPRGVALGLTYLIMVAILVGVGLLAGAPLAAELQALVSDLPLSYERVKTSWLISSGLLHLIAQSFPDLNNLVPAANDGQWNALLQGMLGMTMGSLDFISKLMIVVVLSIYWNAGQDHFKRLWLSLLPFGCRMRARETWENMEREIGAYLRSELIQSLLLGLILGFGYQLIGLKYPVLLALAAAAGWLIVWFGGLVAVIPAFLVGLSSGPVTALAAVLLTIAVLLFLEFILEPRLYDRHHLSSFLVVVMMLIMVKQVGLAGFLLAPPLAAALQIIGGQWVRLSAAAQEKAEPLPAGKMLQLRERLSTVHNRLVTSPEPPPREVVSLVERLDELVERANREEMLSD